MSVTPTQMQTPPPYPGLEPESSGIGDYLGALRRRRKLLLMVGLPILAIGATLALALPDVYRSEGQIEIEGAQAVKQNPNALAQDPEESPYADQYVRSLSTVVLSDRNLAKLLAEHKLYDDQADDPAGALQELRGDIKVDIVTVPILDPNTGRERDVVTAFSVAYDNKQPQRAQEGAEWLVNAFLAENRNDRQRQAGGRAKFFAGEAERMRTHVGQLEARLAEFKQKNSGKLPELNEMNLNVMDRTENDINNVESQMQALRRERVFLVSQLAQARSASPEAGNLRALEDEYARKSVQYDQSHPDLIMLRRQIDQLKAGGSGAGLSLKAQLQTQRSILAEARQRYSEDHPDVQRIQRNIQSLEARIASGETADVSTAADSPMAMQLQTQLNATDTQLAALQARAMDLRTKLSGLEGRIVAAPEVEREYQAVTRDLAGARAKYDELLKRQMDAEVSEAAIAGGTADKFQVKSSPKIPDDPAKPQRIAIMIIAAVLATIASITTVILAQLFDSTVRSARDIQDILGVAPLASVPVIKRPGAKKRKGGTPAYAATAVAAIAIMIFAVVVRFVA
ncbi:GumC family protein [Peristeroidobacter soli]|uniref:GumC family protein n=1 Tax=Peristeroidobacter soli TaxID=2497877 RepID=UPI00101DFD5D|nr:Wzz/FepE/Etk N-terminal domain-containing protein [Peristeroidobacter soli]